MKVTYDIVEKTSDAIIPDGWWLRQTIQDAGTVEETYKGPFLTQRDVLFFVLAQGPHDNPFKQQDGSLEVNLPAGTQYV